MVRDAQADLAALRIALQSTLQTLSSPIDTPSNSTDQPSLAALHSSLVTLVTRLKKHSTALALALGKKPATAHAALPSLGELAEEWKRVLWVVREVEGGGAGGGEADRPKGSSALAREWRWWADALGEGLAGLVRAFLEDADLFPLAVDCASPAAPPPPANPGSSAQQPPYLAKIGTIFALVDSLAARPGSTGSLSRSTDEAVRKRWTSDGEGLRDGEREAREMAEDDASDSEDDDDDDEGGAPSEAESEDDWARLLGEAAGKKPTAAERELIKATLPLLKLSISLHTHADSAVLSPATTSSPPISATPLPSASTSLSASALDPLLALSAALLEKADDVVAACYAPIDRSELRIAVEGLVEGGLELASGAEGAVTGDQDGKAKRYFALWRIQVGRVRSEIEDRIASAAGPGVDDDEALVAKFGKTAIV